MNQLEAILVEIARYVALGQAATNAIVDLIDLANRHGQGNVTGEDFDREIEAIDSAVMSANAKDRQKLATADGS